MSIDDLCEPIILSSPQIDEEREGLSNLVYDAGENDYGPLQDNNDLFHQNDEP